MRVAHAQWLNGASGAGSLATFMIVTLLASSLVSLAAAADTWVIYPKDGTKTDQTGPIFKKLEDLAGKGKVSTSSAVKYGVNFWKCALDDKKAKDLQGDKDVGKNIAVVTKQCQKDCYDPTTSPMRGSEDELVSVLPSALERRKPTNDKAEDELVFLSQQQGKSLKDMGGKYYYDDIAGSGVTVYVVDSGAYLDKQDFNTGANVQSRARWLLVGENQLKDDSSVNTERTSGKGHGTCMLSIVCGAKYGVAKKVNPVIVRVPKSNTVEDWLEGISKVHDDVLARNDKTKHSVMLMAFYFPKDKINDGWIIRARMLIKDLVDWNVLPVTGSGNGALKEVTGYPAAYGKGDIAEIVVAGAVDNEGTPYAGNNNDPKKIPNIYAPGVKVHCASAFKDEQDKTSSGTSDAAASVAGLAAYLWALKVPSESMTPMQIKTYLEFLAFPRKNDASIIATYNGFQSKNGDAPGAVCTDL
ncbi:MAG: hypothetical protein M1812_004481 [Candelaria pacifica]|nr:MAG: hypothetical protein M1812_004481 [Candelaria pacifica]